MGEFDLIARYFTRPHQESNDLPLSIGDDCALIEIPSQHRLAITTDTLVEGTHFLPNISAADLAYQTEKSTPMRESMMRGRIADSGTRARL